MEKFDTIEMNIFRRGHIREYIEVLFKFMFTI